MNRALATEACYHCGEPTDVGATQRVAIADATVPVCCAGCAAAVMLIHGAGLDAYYRLRTENAPKAEDTRRDEWAAYDRDAVQRGLVATLPDGSRELTLLVDGLRCAACSWLVEHALKRIDGVRDVRLNAATARLLLRWDPDRNKLSRILTELAALGYTPHPLTAGAHDALVTRERRTLLKRLWVAGLGTMQVMMYAVAVYIGDGWDLDVETRNLFNWVSLLITVPVVLYSAQPFFTGAWRGVKNRAWGMDVPVSLAIALAFLASVWVTLTGGAEVYYDSVTMFVFFLLAGRWFEMGARHRANRMTEALGKLVPDTAERLPNPSRRVAPLPHAPLPHAPLEDSCGSDATRRDDSRRIAPLPHRDSSFVGALELNPGDLVRVRAGDRFPCDGVISAGTTHVDEALLTGESTPLSRGPGERVVAGSTNLDAPVELVVERAGAGTLVSGIGRLLARAQSERPRIALAADRVARWFAVVMVALAALTFAAWLQIDPARALPITLAVLVVACPCALALATPVALTYGTLSLSKRGLLVTRADALETLARADTVVFDKTGTLTKGDFSVAPTDQAEALAIAAALERASEHPIAKAFRPYDDGRPVEDLQVVRNAGVEGTVGGVRYRLGKPEWVCGSDAMRRDGDGSILIAAHCAAPTAHCAAPTSIAAHCAAPTSFTVTDTLRDGAVELVRRLQADGAHVEILSGDHEAAVARTARELGVDHWAARRSPADKLDRVRELQTQGRIVAVVGDGVNDAPVLAGADVAVAVGSGSALAQSSAGMIVLGETPTPIAAGLPIARRTLRTIRQNLGMSLFYNLGAIPLAAVGLVPPWMAAIGMAASSAIVVMNSVKLR